MHCLDFVKVTEGIKPTLSELEKFESTSEDIDIECIFCNEEFHLN